MQNTTTNLQFLFNKQYLEKALLTMQLETALFQLAYNDFKAGPTLKKACCLRKYFIGEGSKLSINISQQERASFIHAADKYIKPSKFSLATIFKKQTSSLQSLLAVLDTIANTLPPIQTAAAEFKPEWNIAKRAQLFEIEDIAQEFKKAGFNIHLMGLEQFIFSQSPISKKLQRFSGIFLPPVKLSTKEDLETSKRMSLCLKY